MYVHHQSTDAIPAALLPFTDSPRMALDLAVSLFPVCHCRSVFALLYLALCPGGWVLYCPLVSGWIWTMRGTTKRVQKARGERSRGISSPIPTLQVCGSGCVHPGLQLMSGSPFSYFHSSSSHIYLPNVFLPLLAPGLQPYSIPIGFLYLTHTPANRSFKENPRCLCLLLLARSPIRSQMWVEIVKRWMDEWKDEELCFWVTPPCEILGWLPISLEGPTLSGLSGLPPLYSFLSLFQTHRLPCCF